MANGARQIANGNKQLRPSGISDRGGIVMLCYPCIRTELAISAKGILMMKEAGFKPAAPDGTREKFVELKHLEKNIGVTGRLAMKPLLHQSTHDLWQLHHLDS
jgi:hypothetical protein